MIGTDARKFSIENVKRGVLNIATTVGVADVISALLKELRAVFDCGYTFEEAVQILNQPEDRGLRVSTMRQYPASEKQWPTQLIAPNSQSWCRSKNTEQPSAARNTGPSLLVESFRRCFFQFWSESMMCLDGGTRTGDKIENDHGKPGNYPHWGRVLADTLGLQAHNPPLTDLERMIGKQMAWAGGFAASRLPVLLLDANAW